MERKLTALAAVLLAIAAPARAASPDTEAVEFYNQTTGHYFVTATASEALGIDAGVAGAGWQRTGRSFQAWLSKSGAPADARPVCRFYSTAANSHFYTADPTECQTLKDMAAQELAATGTVRGWGYEGTAFYIQAPSQGGSCPAGTTAITRVYNDGFANGEGSNHRFVDDHALAQLMVDRHWIAEGTVFCAATKAATGTDANLAPTTQSFDAIAGTWTGSARWKVETPTTESHDVQALSLSIAADGTLSGTGDGCSFTGHVQSGDGFRSFFQASASATGCTDPAFNGDYAKVRLERFGATTLMVRLQRGSEANEVSIEARLDNPDASTPPAAPASGFDSVAGDWAGTVAWVAEQQLATGNMIEPAANNKPLSLSISTAGAVTGSGFGCTVTGNLQPFTGRDDHGGFGGEIDLAGCDQAAFDGSFTHVRIVRAGPSRLVVNLERETQDAQSKSSVEIEGTLQSGNGTTNTPPPAPPANAPTLPGAWHGSATFLAAQRSHGSDQPVASSVETLDLTIGADGAVSGSGMGCSFSGTLSLGAGGRTASGTISASGCSNAVFNGAYANAQLELDDGRLQVELERETQASDSETKVQIRGRLSPAP